MEHATCSHHEHSSTLACGKTHAIGPNNAEAPPAKAHGTTTATATTTTTTATTTTTTTTNIQKGVTAEGSRMNPCQHYVPRCGTIVQTYSSSALNLREGLPSGMWP